VKSANNDLKKIKEALDSTNLESVDFWTKKLSFHFSSHVLHSIFWTNLTNKQTTPTGELLKRIEKNFGSYDKLKTYITSTSKNVDGNGWGILGYQPYADSLAVFSCENHEKLTQWGVVEQKGEVKTAGPGEYIVKPRGIFHTFWNAGDERVRIIEIITPGNFEHYFAEIAPFLSPGKAPEFDKVGAIAARYGLEFDMGAGVGIIKKYGLKSLID